MKTNKQVIEELSHFTSIILDSAIQVHKEMGPGLLESVYHHCLMKELKDRALHVDAKVIVPLHYRGQSLNKDYVIDLLVEDEIIVELKAIEGLLPIHEAQVISYLKLANKRIGLLINFNVPLLKQCISLSHSTANAIYPPLKLFRCSPFTDTTTYCFPPTA